MPTMPGAESKCEALCLACALCCDGTLFARVPLLPEEVLPEGLTASVATGGGRFLGQPCRALGGRRCSVYDARPRVCRSFECLLRSALLADEVSMEEALAVVQRARQVQSAGSSVACEEFLRFYFGRR